MQQPDHSDEIAVESAALKPWIAPKLDRLPLDEALSGSASNGAFVDGLSTYPS